MVEEVKVVEEGFAVGEECFKGFLCGIVCLYACVEVFEEGELVGDMLRV